MTEIFAERPPVQAAIENRYLLRWHWFDDDGNKDGIEDFDQNDDDDEDGLEDSNVDLEKAAQLYSSWPSALYHHNNLIIISAALNSNELRLFSSFDFCANNLFHSVANLKRATIILKSVIT